MIAGYGFYTGTSTTGSTTVGSTWCDSEWDYFVEVAADKLIQNIRQDERFWEILRLAEKARETVRLISKQVFCMRSIWLAPTVFKMKILFCVSGHLPIRIRKMRK